MTHKTNQILKMIPLTVLYLLLSTETAKTSGFSELGETIIPGEKFQFSTDILDDGNNVLTITVYDTSKQLLGLLIKVVSSDRPDDTKSTCFVPFQAPKDMGILPVRRLSRSTVLLSAHEIRQSDDRLRLILVNTRSCKYDYAYRGATTEKRFIFTSKHSSDERFALIENCRDDNNAWCRMDFEPSREPPYQKYDLLNFNFSSFTRVLDIEPVTSTDDGDLIVARLVDTRSNTHVMRLYDFTKDSSMPKHRDLITLTNWMNSTKYPFLMVPWGIRSIEGTGYTPFDYEVKFADLSFCWCADSRGNESIHCSLFREDGSLEFNRTVVYPEPMFPWRVESIPNGLILFSLRTNRLTNREWRTVKVAVITRNVNDNGIPKSIFPFEENQSAQIKHLQYELACYKVVAWKTRVNESDGSIEVEYMCLHQSSITNHLLYIQ